MFENGSRNFAAVANSIESDFVSTFTDCTISQFITSDNAFERLASSFDLYRCRRRHLGCEENGCPGARELYPRNFQ